MGADREEDGNRVRKYPWGTVSGKRILKLTIVENPKHSDFSILRKILLNTHLDDFKEITHDVLYEGYRTMKLSNAARSPNGEE
jgi:cell division control protein 11